MRVLFSLLAILAIALPSMAAVTIDVAVVGDTATVTYSADAGDEPCAFALDVIPEGAATLDGEPTFDATTYNVFIDYASDNSSAYTMGAGKPWANLTTAGEATDLSAGFCYSAANLENDDAANGTLFVVKGAGSFALAANTTRGGVVKAGDTPAVDVTFTGLTDGKFTLASTPVEPYLAADVDEWIALGRPNSWLDNRQCHGEADGDEVIAKTGNYWVGQGDLNLLIAGWQKTTYTNEAECPWIAADFDHTEVVSKTGNYRVGQNDLNILIANWQASPAADCGHSAQ